MVDYSPLVNGPDIGAMFRQGVQQGREMRLQGQRDNALQALSQNPNDAGAINALMAVDPRTAFEAQRFNMARRQQEQEMARDQAFAGALANAPGVPQQARDYAAQTGDAQGAQQIMQLYAQADEQQRAVIKRRVDFLATTSPLLKQVADPNERLARAQKLAAQNGFDPSQVTPDTITDFALDGAAAQALGLKGQLEQADKQLSRQIQMRGQDIQVRGQDISAANAAAARAVQIRGQDMARGNAMLAAGNVKPPAGYRWNARGELEGVPGGPADPSKMKLTGEQAKSAGQLALARQAEKTLGQFRGTPSEAALMAYGTMGLERTVDAPTRRVLGAQMAFTEAALRFSTGAAYTETEIKNNVRMYFPRPGDTPEAIRDKAALRQQMIQAMELGAGPAAPRVRTQPTTPARQAPARQPAASGGFSIRRID